MAATNRVTPNQWQRHRLTSCDIVWHRVTSCDIVWVDVLSLILCSDVDLIWHSSQVHTLAEGYRQEVGKLLNVARLNFSGSQYELCLLCARHRYTLWLRVIGKRWPSCMKALLEPGLTARKPQKHPTSRCVWVCMCVINKGEGATQGHHWYWSLWQESLKCV